MIGRCFVCKIKILILLKDKISIFFKVNFLLNGISF